jgi:hypothetical protein
MYKTYHFSTVMYFFKNTILFLFFFKKFCEAQLSKITCIKKNRKRNEMHGSPKRIQNISENSVQNVNWKKYNVENQKLNLVQEIKKK